MHFHCTEGDVADSFRRETMTGFCNRNRPKAKSLAGLGPRQGP